MTLRSSEDYFLFYVKACKEAHIALAELPGVTTYNTYEVILGADDNKVRRDDMEVGQILRRGKQYK